MPYTKTTDFAIKDTYLSGNPAKVVRGAEIDTEFENIETNFNSIGPLGTAAAATLTTTATDTTAGRVLKVGDFGAGAAAGTALWGNANLVKTTSATDTTAGSMLKVGDFGVGTPIPTANLNTITGTGLFACGDVTGTPGSSLLGWWVYQIDAGAGFWKNQTAWMQGNPADQYVRSSGDGTTWGAWSKAVFADSPVFTGTPSGPTAAPGTNTTQFATTAFVLANQSGFGIGQTWQDVTGSRSSGTTYTNSTNKPIFVSVRSNVDDGVAELTVDGIKVAINGSTVGSGDNRHTVCASVPNGSTYSYSGSAISLWSEMR